VEKFNIPKENVLSTRKNQFVDKEKQYIQNMTSSASSDSSTSFYEKDVHGDEHNSRLGSFLHLEDPSLGGKATPSSSFLSPPSKFNRSRRRSVKIQTEKKHRNVGIQIMKDSSSSLPDTESGDPPTVDKKDGDSAALVEWDVKILENFIKETVEKLLAEHDKKRTAEDLQNVKAMIDISMGRVLQKLESKIKTDIALTSKKVVNDPNYRTPKLVPLELSYHPSDLSLHSFADFDARGNLTPPPPSPNSSCSSLVLDNDMYVLGSSPSREHSTLPSSTTDSSATTEPSLSVGPAENMTTRSNVSTEIASTRVHPETPSIADNSEGAFLSQGTASSVEQSQHQLSSPAGESFESYTDNCEALNNNFVVLIPFQTDEKCCSYNQHHIHKPSY